MAGLQTSRHLRLGRLIGDARSELVPGDHEPLVTAFADQIDAVMSPHPEYAFLAFHRQALDIHRDLQTRRCGSAMADVDMGADAALARLDAEASAILNDLYRGATVEEPRLARILSLFRMELEPHPSLRSDMSGRPVYLAMAMNARADDAQEGMSAFLGKRTPEWQGR